MGSDDVIRYGNYVMIAKWRLSWIRHLGFLEFPKLQDNERKIIKRIRTNIK